MLQHGVTVEMLFPNLERLSFTTLRTVSQNIVKSLGHSGLKELSFDENDYADGTAEDDEWHVPLVGDPSSLEHVFLKSFPLLTNLSFTDLVIGNNRCKTILSSLQKHQHLRNLRIIHCYTDEELDPIVSAINMENRMKVNIEHDKAQKCLECRKMSSSLADALCHRTSIQELILRETVFTKAWFSDENERTVDSKVQKLLIESCLLELNDPSTSRDIAKFLCLQPCLTDLTILLNGSNYNSTRLHDEFYHELARLASFSKVKELSIECCDLRKNDPSASRDAARFLCLQPCLTDLTIRLNDVNHEPIHLHDVFYHELARLASSSKVQELSIDCFNLAKNDPSASRDVARFFCLQPCLTNLTIGLNYPEYTSMYIHDEFYHKLACPASSSKVQKLSITRINVEANFSSVSDDLSRFLCLQPCLIELMIGLNDKDYLHDEFFHGLARLASSSKVQRLTMECCNLKRNDPSASRDLARFICLQPCLIDLTIGHSHSENGPTLLHNEFYHELARLASSSKIEKLCINCDLGRNDATASRAFAQFLCLLPCLTKLTKDPSKPRLHDDFYHEISLLASSSKRRFVRENLHMWSAKLQQQQGQHKQLDAFADLETSCVFFSELNSTDEPTQELNEECAPCDGISSVSYSSRNEEANTDQGGIDEDQSSPPRKRKRKTDREAP